MNTLHRYQYSNCKTLPRYTLIREQLKCFDFNHRFVCYIYIYVDILYNINQICGVGNNLLPT